MGVQASKPQPKSHHNHNHNNKRYASKTCDTTAWKSYPSKKVQDLVFANTKRSEIHSKTAKL